MTINPSVSLLMGGHDHENSRNEVGNVRITKADGNALTAYVHRFSYDLRTKKTTVRSELVEINDRIADDPATAAVVKKADSLFLMRQTPIFLIS